LDVAVVVVPTYNEAENIEPLVERFHKVREALSNIDLHLLIVDDSSPDGTAALVTRQSSINSCIHLLTRKGKLGLMTAYRDGFEHAINEINPSKFVQMDADLQHPPEKIPEILNQLKKGADVAVASRYMVGGGSEGWSWARALISKGANWFARFTLGLGVKDVTSGFRGLNKTAVSIFLSQRLSSKGFAFQVESIWLYKRKGLTIVEVPFVFKRRAAGKSKLSAGEILRFAKTVLVLRFK
jgi:dolichol-phosphate mannosyltransferase